MAFNATANSAIFAAALFLILSSHFILTSSCNTGKHENQRFCPIESKTLKAKCGHYINNGGLGVSDDCCELLRQADDVDTSLASCLCPQKLHKNRRCHHHHHHHRDRMYKPQTAVNIVNACNLLTEYDVDLSCK